jgi:hypothetical protein
VLYFVIATIEGRESLLERSVSSIQDIFCDYDVEIVIVRQYEQSQLSSVLGVSVINIKSYGASQARNIGFDSIQSRISPDDFLAFPDDDSFYISSPLFNLSEIPNVDIIFGDVVNEITHVKMGLSVLSSKLPFSLIYHVISCPSFFIRPKLFSEIRFNEMYGPGSFISACEETEFFFRLKNKFKIVWFHDSSLIIGHPSSIGDSKIFSYSLSQASFVKYLIFNREFNIFYYFSLLRPFCALFYSLMKFDFVRSRLYFFRCKGLVYGFFKKQK